MHSVEILTKEHLDQLGVADEQVKAYLSDGSVGYCLLVDDIPVFAGGVVNLKWHRGEAWILPNRFFRSHIKTCFSYAKSMLPLLAQKGRFRRIQATCTISVSTILFHHLGFDYEGMLRCFGPNGEACYMYARLF